MKPEASSWQPIETAPKDGTELLLYGVDDDRPDNEPRARLGWWSTSAWWGPAWIWCENRSDTEYFKPTHWMPLPDPPTGGEAKSADTPKA